MARPNRRPPRPLRPAGRGGAVPGDSAVYFELSGKVCPAPYDPARIPADSEADPLSRIMGYARVLLRDHKVVLKE